MDKLKSRGKPFDISKWEVWEAFQVVKENKGAPELCRYPPAEKAAS